MNSGPPQGETKPEPSSEHAKQLGAKAGVVSPRLADCSEHCAHMLGEAAQELNEQERGDFTQGCRAACEQQVAGARSRAAPPQGSPAVGAAAQWRSLYLMNALLEQQVWCIRQTNDQSPEARTLVSALEAAKKTPDSLAGDEAEHRLAGLGKQLAETPEGQHVIASREELSRANAEDPRSAKANAARSTVGAAEQAAMATVLGQRVAAAAAAANAARAKANETPQMADAVRAWEAYLQAWQARVASAPAVDQPGMRETMTKCIDSYVPE